MEINEILEHFPAEIGLAIERYVDNKVLHYSRYLFTHREGSHQYAYCTYCETTARKTHLRTGQEATCPNCGSFCRIKASGVSRKYLYDHRYFVFYERSTYDPTAIIARGISVTRDYRGDYHNVKNQYDVQAYYLFKPGEAYMLKRVWFYTEPTTYDPAFERCKSVYPMHPTDFYNRDDLDDVVKGTPLQYSCWDKYNHEDMVKFFAMAARYPCVEYLTKMGFGRLLQAKLFGQNTYGSINWRGSSPMKVLRLTKRDLKEIKDTGIHVDFSFLRYLQLSRKDGSNLSFCEIKEIDKNIGGYYSDLQGILRRTTLRRAYGYLVKQKAVRPHLGRPYYSETQVLRNWRDYIEDCKKLEMDLTDEQTLFPRNLYQAHQNTIAQVQHKADEALNRQIAENREKLKTYHFERYGFIIRPAASTDELIAEGKALHHCVGNYAKSYAEGRTIILVIRQKKQPDKPFFTMEVWNGKITQVRGLRNCDPDDTVKKFVEAFAEARLQKAKESRVRVTVPA